jgi:hypothetical protein
MDLCGTKFSQVTAEAAAFQNATGSSKLFLYASLPDRLVDNCAAARSARVLVKRRSIILIDVFTLLYENLVEGLTSLSELLVE